MKTLINRMFCKHDWSNGNVNEIEIPVGSNGSYMKFAESAMCLKCGKRRFNWVKTSTVA